MYCTLEFQLVSNLVSITNLISEAKKYSQTTQETHEPLMAKVILLLGVKKEVEYNQIQPQL